MYLARGDFNLFSQDCVVIPRKCFRRGDPNSKRRVGERGFYY